MSKRKLVVITRRDEPVWGEEKLKNDYDIIRFNAHPWASWMDDYYSKKSYKTIRDITLKDTTLITRQGLLPKNILSLLHNWRLMLEQYSDLPDDTIFGESDIYPVSDFDWDSIPWDSDYDAFRLYITSEFYTDFREKPNEVKWLNLRDVFSNWRQYHWNWYRVHCGTHAFIIPKHKRKKFAECFIKYYDPADISVLRAVENKDLKLAVTNYNVFTQYPHGSHTGSNSAIYTG